MEFSVQEVTEICDAADKAWKRAGPKVRVVRFDYRGVTYRSRLTTFRMLVETPRGKPVACRYF